MDDTGSHQHPVDPSESRRPGHHALATPASKTPTAKASAAAGACTFRGLPIVDRLTFGGNIIQTGTDSYRLAHARARAEQHLAG
jgi:hypothetical protein